MNLTQIRAKAKELELKYSKVPKEELIRAIQVKEGNFPCFGTAENDCDQAECAWRKECLAG